jgi:exopolyphosphatase/guanosine-5'-triphosphate,3'-diphosphate pyrophosphatase
MQLHREIEKALRCIPSDLEGELVGIGGTAATLGSMHMGLDIFDRDRIHGMQLSLAELRTRVKELQEKDLSARKQITGLPPDRADIILAGAIIILSSMERLGKDSIHISCHGLRYGLFYKRFMNTE